MVWKRRWLLGAAIASLAALLGSTILNQGDDPAAGSVTLIVSAAASVQDALAEVVRAYEVEKPEVKVNLNFASSGALQQQIERGAPVDVFLAASPRQMDALQAKDLLLSETRRNLFSNQIVLVTSRDRDAVIKGFAGLTAATVKRIVIGEPESVPAGTYAKEVRSSLQLYSQLAPKLVFAKDVRQALAYVESGNVSAGLIYATEAALSAQVHTVATASPSSHTSIVYPVAAIQHSRQPDAARAFVDFLVSDAARLTFERYGFTPIP